MSRYDSMFGHQPLYSQYSGFNSNSNFYFICSLFFRGEVKTFQLFDSMLGKQFLYIQYSCFNFNSNFNSNSNYKFYVGEVKRFPRYDSMLGKQFLYIQCSCFNLNSTFNLNSNCNSNFNFDYKFCLGEVKTFPRYDSMLGHQFLYIQGPCFTLEDDIWLQFGPADDPIALTNCTWMSAQRAWCVVPTFFQVGRLETRVSNNDAITFPFTGTFDIGMHENEMSFFTFIVFLVHFNLHTFSILISFSCPWYLSSFASSSFSSISTSSPTAVGPRFLLLVPLMLLPLLCYNVALSVLLFHHINHQV